jgi:hypothetical protein
MTTFRENLVTRTRNSIALETYEHDGALFWKSNDRPVPMHVFKEAQLDAPATQRDCCEASDREFIEAYKASQRQRSPEAIAEQRREARAAMGPGVTMVNVITGERFRT